MNKNFFTFKNLGGNYPALENELRLGTPTAVFGVSEANKNLVIDYRYVNLRVAYAYSYTGKRRSSYFGNNRTHTVMRTTASLLNWL